MIVEPNDMIVAWLDDATDGVNALLPTTPRKSGDAQPDDIASIGSEVSDNDVAREEMPSTLPAIAVSVDLVPQVDGQVQIASRDMRVRMRVRIATENADTAEGKRDLGYYIRTVVRSLGRLFDCDANDARRSLRDMYLESCEDMSWAIARTKDQAGDVTVNAFILFTLQMRDLNPKG